MLLSSGLRLRPGRAAPPRSAAKRSAIVSASAHAPLPAVGGAAAPFSFPAPLRGAAVRAVRVRASAQPRALVAAPPAPVATTGTAAGAVTSSLTVGVPKESADGERRCAATPDSVARLIKAGFSVKVESGLGVGSEISDAAYVAAGESLSRRRASANCAARGAGSRVASCRQH